MPTEPPWKPWKGTEYEAPLLKLKLSRKRKAKVFPPNPRGQLEFRNYVYGVVRTIGRRFRGEQPADIEQRKAAGQRLGLRERPPIPPPSKQAETYRQVASQLMRAAERIEPLQPPVAEQLQRLAQSLTNEADMRKQYTRGRKSHTEHAETRQIRQLTYLIKHETGAYHDRELTELLRLAGYTPANEKALSTLRARSPR